MKRYITEIFDDLSNKAKINLAKEIENCEVKESVDDMTKRRIYNRVMSTIDEGKAKDTGVKRGIRKTSIAAVAIAAALAIAGSAVAAGKLNKSFTDYKSAYTEQQKEEIQKATFAINEQMGGDGVTITVTEGMCDGNKLFLLENIEVDPSKITIPDGYNNLTTSTELHQSGDPDDCDGWSSVYNQVLETNGNKTTVLYVYDMADVTDGQVLGLSASGLSASNDNDSVEIVNRDTNPWGLKFKVQKGRFAKSFCADKGVNLLGSDAAIDSGYVSPWYAQFWISADFIGNIRTAESSDNDFGNPIVKNIFDKSSYPTFKVVMKDGTFYNGIGVRVDPQVQEIEKEKTYHAAYYFRCTFKDYVDTANIDHVEVNGTELELKDVELEEWEAANR